MSVAGDSVPALLSQLTVQSQITFSFTARSGGNASPPVNLNLKDVPLWDAVRRIQDAAGPEGTVLWRIGDGPRSQQVGEPFSNAGPFIIRVAAITHNADYGRPDAEAYYLNVQTLTDASARIVSVQHASNPTRALDDAGNSLVPEAPAPSETDMVPERGGGQRAVETVRILLKRPKTPLPGPGGRTLKLLEGTLPLTIATKLDTLRLGFPSSEQRKYGPVEVEIKCSITNFGRAASGMLETTITFTRPDTLNDEEWDRTAKIFAATRVRLVGPGDQLIATTAGGESTTTTRRMTDVLYPPPANNPSPQVLIEIPAEYKSILIPYHFENLPLP